MAKISKILKATVCAACASVAVAGAAKADESAFSYYWTVTAASDYLFRGISYTQNNPTVNSYVELDYATGGLLGTAYIAFWTSNINTCDTTAAPYACLGPVEQDIYVGVRPVTGPISWDIAAWYYMYEAKQGRDSSDYDYVEFKVSASATPVTNLAVGVTGYFTPDQDVASPSNIAVEGTVAYTLPQFGPLTPTIGGLVGFQDADDNDFYTSGPGGGYWGLVQEYTYWNAGVKFTVEKFFMDFRYWDTDIPDNKYADERFVFSAGVNLP